MVGNSLVSVIMPVYNAPESFLREAISSVLQQTYSNFELLIIDDGSQKPVNDTINDVSDKRIRLFCNDKNQGLPYTLNRGIEESRGKYIFRMDADDKCIERRFEKQVAFFEEHSDIDIVSTFSHLYEERDGVYRSSLTDEKIKAELLWKNPIVHPTVALRAQTVKDKGIKYSSEFLSEDFGLWSFMAFQHNCKFAVIPQELLLYRIHEVQVTKTKKAELKVSEKKVLSRTFEYLGIDLKDYELDLYCTMRNGELMSLQDFKSVLSVMRKILNNVSDGISTSYLKYVYRKAILKYCKKYNKFIELSGVLKL